MSSDPIIEIILKEPLSGWSLEELSIQKWSIDTLIIFFAIMLIIWTLKSKNPSLSAGNILFRYGKENISLMNGNSYSKIARECYRDAPEDTLLDARKRIENGEKWEKVLSETFKNTNDWLFQIITSDSRSKFLKDRMPKPDDLVLDIGAGWGQFSIPLAKSNKVCSLEPTPERLDIIQSIAQQEKVSENMYFIGTNYLDIEFHTKFDLILSIGVLEWVGKFNNSDISPDSAQFEFLKKTRYDLSEEGQLVIGIENRLGLKYLLGANDDHTGLPHISYLSKELAKSKFKKKTKDELCCLTYSIKEYYNLLKDAGFQKIIFHAALPDYKLPKKIFPISDDLTNCGLNKFVLDGGKIEEHDGSNGKKLENLDEIYSMYHSLAEMNLAHYFAPSFFIEAS
jgi:2-polyprenyl-3-methyl-5-hydroxy-6-metoxy-1,4-benzoquinol methylase